MVVVKHEGRPGPARLYNIWAAWIGTSVQLTDRALNSGKLERWKAEHMTVVLQGHGASLGISPFLDRNALFCGRSASLRLSISNLRPLDWEKAHHAPRSVRQNPSRQVRRCDVGELHTESLKDDALSWKSAWGNAIRVLSQLLWRISIVAFVCATSVYSCFVISYVS